MAQVSPQPSSTISSVIDRPKLPTFKGGDDMTSFLIRFERDAELLNVNRNTYAARIKILLSGRAVDRYASLPLEATINYDTLKEALLFARNFGPRSVKP